MDLGKGLGHLTYSTLVHPGDTWDDMWTSLTTYVPQVQKRVCPTAPFGVCKFQPVKGPLETWEAEKLDIVRATFEAFARAVQGGPAFPIPPAEIIHGASVSEAVIRSASSGKVEKVS